MEIRNYTDKNLWLRRWRDSALVSVPVTVPASMNTGDGESPLKGFEDEGADGLSIAHVSNPWECLPPPEYGVIYVVPAEWLTSPPPDRDDLYIPVYPDWALYPVDLRAGDWEAKKIITHILAPVPKPRPPEAMIMMQRDSIRGDLHPANMTLGDLRTWLEWAAKTRQTVELIPRQDASTGRLLDCIIQNVDVESQTLSVIEVDESNYDKWDMETLREHLIEVVLSNEHAEFARHERQYVILEPEYDDDAVLIVRVKHRYGPPAD